MAAEPTDDDARGARDEDQRQRLNGKDGGRQPPEEEDEDDDEEEDDEDEEPKLKYTRLTSSLAPVYRNGDATSTFLVAGDKMVGPGAVVWRIAHAKFPVDCRIA